MLTVVEGGDSSHSTFEAFSEESELASENRSKGGPVASDAEPQASERPLRVTQPDSGVRGAIRAGRCLEFTKGF